MSIYCSCATLRVIRNYVRIIRNYVRIIRNYVRILRNYVRMLRNYVRILRNYVRILRNYVRIIHNLVHVVCPAFEDVRFNHSVSQLRSFGLLKHLHVPNLRAHPPIHNLLQTVRLEFRAQAACTSRSFEMA